MPAREIFSELEENRDVNEEKMKDESVIQKITMKIFNFTRTKILMNQSK